MFDWWWQASDSDHIIHRLFYFFFCLSQLKRFVLSWITKLNWFLVQEKGSRRVAGKRKRFLWNMKWLIFFSVFVVSVVVVDFVEFVRVAWHRRDLKGETSPPLCHMVTLGKLSICTVSSPKNPAGSLTIKRERDWEDESRRIPRNLKEGFRIPKRVRRGFRIPKHHKASHITVNAAPYWRYGNCAVGTFKNPERISILEILHWIQTFSRTNQSRAAACDME